MLSRLPVEMLATKIAVDIAVLGTSLVIKYSDGSLQYEALDKVVAMSSDHADFYFELKHRQSSIERGQTVTTVINVMPTKKFDGFVVFRAVDPPADMNISFEPAKTKDKTVMTIRCGNATPLGQTILQIKATAAGIGIVREFDLVIFVANSGSGLGVNILPQKPVNGQAAVLNTNFTTQSGNNVPAGTPLQYMQHTGWTASPTYKGGFGNWDTINANSSVGLTSVHHEYTNLPTMGTNRMKARLNRRNRAL